MSNDDFTISSEDLGAVLDAYDRFCERFDQLEAQQTDTSSQD